MFVMCVNVCWHYGSLGPSHRQVKRQLRVSLRREADKAIRQKKLEMFHKSKKYLSQVHEKVQAALTKVK